MRNLKLVSIVTPVYNEILAIDSYFSKVLNFIKGDQTMLEKEPLEKLTRKGQLMAFEHKGFWKCMDTMRDKIFLNKLWKEGNALWKK